MQQELLCVITYVTVNCDLCSMEGDLISAARFTPVTCV